MLFPWQSFLNNPAINGNAADVATGIRIPGALYTWAEFNNAQMGPRFSTETSPDVPAARQAGSVVLHWARYVGFPIASIVVLLLAQLKCERGLKLAIREPVASDDLTVSIPQL